MEKISGSGDYVESRLGQTMLPGESPSSGVSWPAVMGGAFVAAAFYLILLALGAGFGLSAISPWSNSGRTAATFGTVASVWLVLIEVIAAGLGGYLTGRLRTKWALVHTDEVFFRDTANGFLSWAVALVISVTLLASAASSMVGHVAEVRAGETGGGPNSVMEPSAYFLDTLFRSDRPSVEFSPAVQAEAGRIFAHALTENDIPAEDRTYLARLVSARTGLSQADAEKRVSDGISNARQAEDTARKVMARLLLTLFLALLMGAFSASFAATIGGRVRDHVKAI